MIVYTPRVIISCCSTFWHVGCRGDCLKPFAMLLTTGEFPLVSLWIEPGYGVIGRNLEMQMAAQEQR